MAKDETTETKEQKAETIFVKSALTMEKDGGSRVALYETDASHPDGEAFVAGDKAVEVAQTPEVMRALAEGRIVKTTKAEAKKEEKK